MLKSKGKINTNIYVSSNITVLISLCNNKAKIYDRILREKT